jgi:hypothetical protein
MIPAPTVHETIENDLKFDGLERAAIGFSGAKAYTSMPYLADAER